MVRITQLCRGQVSEAKAIISASAYPIFEAGESFEEFAASIERGRELRDVDEFECGYENGFGAFLVAFEGERMIGTGALRRFNTRVVELTRMWFLPAYQGRGFAQELMNELIRRAIDMQYKELWLQTNPVQQRAIAFYQKIGFREIEIFDREFPDDVAMALTFNPRCS